MSKGKKLLSSFLTFTLLLSLFVGMPTFSEATTVNLALGKTANASSGVAALSFDGNTGTRWESDQKIDPQWISVDLGSSCILTGVKLNWETAAGKDYKIQVSTDNQSWVDAYTRTGGTGGVENLNFPAPVTGEYVRMLGTARTTTYGYSLWEFEVYGAQVTDKLSAPLITPGSGTYTSEQLVNIVDGTTGAAIRYTIDGSIPTPTLGTVYTGTFKLSETATINAIAYNSATDYSEIATSTITINIPPPNISTGKTAIASSSNGTNVAANAFDSDGTTTRWESATSDPQWISVDLGSRYSVTGVQLKWESAAALNYIIQVSKDNATWTDAYTVIDGKGGELRKITFPSAVDGRYVRMYGKTRTTTYGYSLYDFQVYGTAITNMVQAPEISPQTNTFGSAQLVTIKDSSTSATIRYTTDGSYPTMDNGTTYTGGFTITGTTTVEAVAYETGMNESNLALSNITILNPPAGLAGSSSASNTVNLTWSSVLGASYNLYRSSSVAGTYTKINSADIVVTNYTDIGLNADTIYYYKVSAKNTNFETDLSEGVAIKTNKASVVDFGPNVYIFDPSMPSSSIQSITDNVFAKSETNQFGTDRYAFLFKPGSYNNDVKVGFYTSVYGLGQNPDDVNITGAVRVDADWMGGNATCNFWRSIENLAIIPTVPSNSMTQTGTLTWAVAQAAPMRRVHVKGNLSLWDPFNGNYDGAWSSGGFIADSIVDGEISSASQQQFFTRNSKMRSWSGANWNMVYVGDTGAPAASFPTPPVTVIDKTPIIKEKPFLNIDADGKYSVFVPSIKTDTKDVTWANGVAAGTSLPISDFYIAKSTVDTSTTLNEALSNGKNLLFTPGIYHLNATLNVTRANTVVLGIGMPTLLPDNGTAAMSVADVDGVNVAGILFEAGTTNSTVLLEVGQNGSSADHSANPTTVSDLFFRVGGAFAGKTESCIQINSNNVIGDHFWVWRADHGAGAGWTDNVAKNGVIVNGDNVTMYALFCEHFNGYDTVWNGNGGRTYFYQNEKAYDVPNQAAWMDGTKNGFAAYKVSDNVTTHEAWGLGVYSNFTEANVKLNSAIEIPVKSGVKIHNATTIFLSSLGEITHVINNIGGAVNAGAMKQTVTDFPSQTDYPTFNQVTLDSSNTSIQRTKTAQLTLVGNNNDGSLVDLSTATKTYTISDPSVVSIDANGLITANKIGNTDITATVTLAGVVIKSNPITINVVEMQIDPISMGIEISGAAIEVGNEITVTLKARDAKDLYGFDMKFDYDPQLFQLESEEVNSDFAADKTKVQLVVNDANGAMRLLGTLVGQNAGITGDIGLVNLTFKVKNMAAEASSFVLLKESVFSNSNAGMCSLVADITKSISVGTKLVSAVLSSDNLIINKTNTAKLKITGTLENGAIADLTNAAIKYFSDNPSVVSVDSNGIATANLPGNADITAAVTLDGNLVETNKVTITVNMDKVPMDIVYEKAIIEEGDSTAIVLRAIEVQSLAVFNLSFKYDTTLFDFENVVLNDKFTVVGTIKNDNGNVSISGKLKDGNSAVSGDIDMVTITLKSKNVEGSTPLTIVKGTYLSDINEASYTLNDDIVEHIAIANSRVTGGTTASIGDLVLVAKAFGKNTPDSGYSANIDMNKDGVIDIIDIAYVAAKILGR